MDGVRVDLVFGEPNARRQVSASLASIASDFAAMVLRPPLPPPDEEVEFRVCLGSILLVAGKGRVAEVDEKGAGRLEAEITHPTGARALASRLAPFVPAEEREEILRGVSPTQALGDLFDAWIGAGVRLSRLVEVSGRINSSESLETLLSEIMGAAKAIMDAEASSLMLLDQETGELVVAVPTGPARAEISGVRIPAGKGLGGWVAATGEPAVVANAEEDPRFYGEISKTGFRTRDLICVPLRDEGKRIIGVLQALNRRGEEPFSPDDVPLFLALADHAAIALEKDRLHREALAKQELEKELSLARAIQEGFLPHEAPAVPGFELAGMSLPATHVGGDYYDYIPLPGGDWAVVVADISGKGFAAALLMASLRAALRAQVENRRGARETVHLLNNVICEEVPSNRFVTLLFGVLSPQSREFVYVNAGHNPPFLYRNGSFEGLTVGGPIVGFRKDLPYEEGAIQLDPGAMLVLFTDGVVEAQDANEEMFGDDRLCELMRRNHHLSASAFTDLVYRSILGFCGGTPQYDDLTLVVLKAV